MARITESSRVIRGASLIELALVLPVLLLIICGILEYGWMFLKAHHVANAARQGARTAALPDSQWSDVTAAVSTAMSTGGMADVAASVQCSPAYGDVKTGDSFSVTVTVAYSDVDLGLPLIPAPTNLSTSVSMIKEGP